MIKIHKRNLLIGSLLMVFAVVAALAAFYQWEVKPELAARQRQSSLLEDSGPVIQEKPAEESVPETRTTAPRRAESVAPVTAEVPSESPQKETTVAAVAKPEPTMRPVPVTERLRPERQATEAVASSPVVEPDSAAVQSEASYGPEERNRREGILWIDQETSSWIATLGTVHGVAEGGRLDVYDGARLLGDVGVQTAFDILSYVEPQGDLSDRMNKSYYTVSIPAASPAVRSGVR